MGRREISETLGWDDVYDRIGYTHDALWIAGQDGDKDVGALVTPVVGQLQSWEKLDGERRAARRESGRASALLRRRQHEAGKRVIEVHNDTLAEVKQKRQHPLFQRLFSSPVSRTVKLRADMLVPALRDLKLKLAEEETPPALRKAHAKLIDESITRTEGAVRLREEAAAGQGRTSARTLAWRKEANSVLLGVEGLLKHIASKRGLDNDWVDTFFPTVEAKKKNGKAEPVKPAKAVEPRPA
jgi:hypothetical protein